jgi:hypothetical protein
MAKLSGKCMCIDRIHFEKDARMSNPTMDGDFDVPTGSFGERPRC